MDMFSCTVYCTNASKAKETLPVVRIPASVRLSLCQEIREQFEGLH